jgi:hypothetical protein
MVVMLRIVVAMALSGCSLLTVHGPHTTEVTTNRPSCTDNYLLPVIDSVLAAGTATGALYFSSTGDELGVVVEGGFAVAFGINALVGISRVKSCKRAITTFETTAARPAAYTPAPAAPAPSP